MSKCIAGDILSTCKGVLNQFNEYITKTDGVLDKVIGFEEVI